MFPIALSNAPPADRARPGGGNGLAAVAAAGVNVIRTGIAGWNSEFSEGQIAQERRSSTQPPRRASSVGLAGRPDRSARRRRARRRARALLTRVVNALKGHPGLGAWKGVDEPRNRFRGENWIRPAGLIRGYQRVKALDPNHPLVITHAPGNPAAQLTPYRPGLRHHRRRHLSGLATRPAHTRDGEPRPQRRRRRDEDAENGGRPEACLDDAADRVERRRPDPGTPASCRASRRCTTSASWPTRRSSTAPAASCSSAGT